jgi:hypothetical protein
MIGPHEGQELELMLAGKKRLAAFGDIIPENGIINEQIIPEKNYGLMFKTIKSNALNPKLKIKIPIPLNMYALLYRMKNGVRTPIFLFVNSFT